MQPKSKTFSLYNYKWHDDFYPGYVVYRDSIDRKTDLKIWILTHYIALFVDGAVAADYCEYRNRLVKERNTDEIR